MEAVKPGPSSGVAPTGRTDGPKVDVGSLGLNRAGVGGSLAVPLLDIRIERATPTLLSLEQAVAWIREKKPILWTGSIFSSASPSRVPSGVTIQRSWLRDLFSNSLPGAGVEIPDSALSEIVDLILPRWP